MCYFFADVTPREVAIGGLALLKVYVLSYGMLW